MLTLNRESSPQATSKRKIRVFSTRYLYSQHLLQKRILDTWPTFSLNSWDPNHLVKSIPYSSPIRAQLGLELRTGAKETFLSSEWGPHMINAEGSQKQISLLFFTLEVERKLPSQVFFVGGGKNKNLQISREYNFKNKPLGQCV